MNLSFGISPQPERARVSIVQKSSNVEMPPGSRHDMPTMARGTGFGPLSEAMMAVGDDGSGPVKGNSNANRGWKRRGCC